MDYPYLEELELIADWREDLNTRIARARLRYEHVGGNGEEVVGLAAEAEDFKALVQVLKAAIT